MAHVGSAPGYAATPGGLQQQYDPYARLEYDRARAAEQKRQSYEAPPPHPMAAYQQAHAQSTLDIVPAYGHAPASAQPNAVSPAHNAYLQPPPGAGGHSYPPPGSAWGHAAAPPSSTYPPPGYGCYPPAPAGYGQPPGYGPSPYGAAPAHAGHPYGHPSPYGMPPPGSYPHPGYPGYPPPSLYQQLPPPPLPYGQSRHRGHSRGRDSRDRDSDDEDRPNRGQGGRRANKKRKRGGSPNGGGQAPQKPVEPAKAEDVWPRVAEAAKEAAGSVFLQAQLVPGHCNDTDRDKIFEAVEPDVEGMATDAHGHLVMIRLLERATEAQRLAVALRVRGKVMDLSLNKFGCRVAQKLIEVLPSDEQARLGSELKRNVIETVKSMHGNHVIQILCKKGPMELVDVVLDEMSRDVDAMSSHMYGCRVLQRLIERCKLEDLDRLIAGVMKKVTTLVQDKHGNYVVQCILEHGSLEDKKRIIQVVRDDFMEFAKGRVASNVVEKCFEVSTLGPDADGLRELRKALYSFILDDCEATNSRLRQLTHDRFGNYTVQCVIKHSRDEDLEALRSYINGREDELKELASGRHILSALKKATGEMPEEEVEKPANAAVSKGSLLHASGRCKPCAWYWKPQGCKNDQDCQHCHLCPEGELKERKKAKRMNMKAGDGDQRDNSP